MEQINIQVKANGEQVEYYDLATVKQKIDAIEAEIGGGGGGNIIEVPGTTTDIEIEAGNVYVWTSEPSSLFVSILAPEDELKLDYWLIFRAEEQLTFVMSNNDDYPMTLKGDGVCAGLNKVHVYCIGGMYMVEIDNYRD